MVLEQRGSAYRRNTYFSLQSVYGWQMKRSMYCEPFHPIIVVPKMRLEKICPYQNYHLINRKSIIN